MDRAKKRSISILINKLPSNAGPRSGRESSKEEAELLQCEAGHPRAFSLGKSFFSGLSFTDSTLASSRLGPPQAAIVLKVCGSQIVSAASCARLKAGAQSDFRLRRSFDQRQRFRPCCHAQALARLATRAIRQPLPTMCTAARIPAICVLWQYCNLESAQYGPK